MKVQCPGVFPTIEKQNDLSQNIYQVREEILSRPIIMNQELLHSEELMKNKLKGLSSDVSNLMKVMRMASSRTNQYRCLHMVIYINI